MTAYFWSSNSGNSRNPSRFSVSSYSSNPGSSKSSRNPDTYHCTMVRFLFYGFGMRRYHFLSKHFEIVSECYRNGFRNSGFLKFGQRWWFENCFSNSFESEWVKFHWFRWNLDPCIIQVKSTKKIWMPVTCWSDRQRSPRMFMNELNNIVHFSVRYWLNKSNEDVYVCVLICGVTNVDRWII